jgi:hypothetical protein
LALARSQELWQQLQDVSSLLSKYGETHWAVLFADFAQRAQAGTDVRGKVHGMWGGMGSLTDLWLCPENGHQLEHDRVEEANQALQDVLEPVWHVVRRCPKE